MEYGVYLESSIVDIKPRVLEFLTKIVEKAKEVKDFAISFKQKELADITGKDTRTVSRYLHELEELDIIKTKGVRGRAGGTVILFNRELIRFDTSDKALINSDEPITIDDVVERKLPKKVKEPKEKTRNRRTKVQMMEAELLKGEKQSKFDQLNKEAQELGGVPNWEWFQKTDNPVGNYRTYLLSRVYNRYAVLFTDQHNSNVMAFNEGNMLPTVSNDYDVMSADFYGSSKWAQFEKFRLFCEENDIDPIVYLSAQFDRSIFTASAKNTKKMLPFVNALTGDASYDVYQHYVKYRKEFSHSYQVYKFIPIKFADDFVIRALDEAYETAESSKGLLQFRTHIADFLEGLGFSEREDHLLDFYRMTEADLHKKNVSLKTRDTIKKFVLLQSMIQSGGANSLPGYFIVGSEQTQVMLASIASPDMTADEIYDMKTTALGMLIAPKASRDEQTKIGSKYFYQYNVLYETRKVLQLIMERRGLHLSLADLSAAFKEYGKENIPVDDYSLLDVDQIVTVMSQQGAVEEAPADIDLEAVTVKSSYELIGEVFDEDSLENALNDFMGSK